MSIPIGWLMGKSSGYCVPQDTMDDYSVSVSEGDDYQLELDYSGGGAADAAAPRSPTRPRLRQSALVTLQARKDWLSVGGGKQPISQRRAAAEAAPAPAAAAASGGGFKGLRTDRSASVVDPSFATAVVKTRSSDDVRREKASLRRRGVQAAYLAETAKYRKTAAAQIRHESAAHSVLRRADKARTTSHAALFSRSKAPLSLPTAAPDMDQDVNRTVPILCLPGRGMPAASVAAAAKTAAIVQAHAAASAATATLQPVAYATSAVSSPIKPLTAGGVAETPASLAVESQRCRPQRRDRRERRRA